MGATERATLGSTPETMARALGVWPLYVVESASGGGLAVAKWRFHTFRAVREEYPQSYLVFRTAGSACVTKICGAKSIRKRPKIGSVTFGSGDGRTMCALDGPSEAVFVYFRRDHIASFAEQHMASGRLPQIDEFFAIEDPWLEGYCQMLTSELECYDGLRRPAESLLLDQTEHLVLRHLVRSHSGAGPRETRGLDLRSKINPLRPALVCRVEEYVDANLTRDISLADLARLSCMSVDHFLRSFRAARGTTPYRYVLEQRLRRAATMLQTTPAPVAAVAAKCGFRNPSHFSVKFHAHFGVSPSQFRRTA
jgi:AraC family transcriptional regulator